VGDQDHPVEGILPDAVNPYDRAEGGAMATKPHFDEEQARNLIGKYVLMALTCMHMTTRL
jgi:hypothetical protein